MRPLIAGNWKMNGLTEPSAALALAIRHGLADAGAEVLLCPPATQLAAVSALVEGSGIATGGQDCHTRDSGAHTGDISPVMLADAGARYVILGHSERRQDHGETSAIVAAKVSAAMKAGLIPIVCVGETESDRSAGEQETVVGSQITESLPSDFTGIIAYEPIWAIGTGKVPTSADIAAMHAFIRGELIRDQAEGVGFRILYGGSVKPGNAAEILGLPDVGGALVGGASLIAEDFLAIIRAV
ncbi:triose-phosphate isomerase [Acidisoma silvae]|uniref:Triosephosphate isomerase n=1 Tax=Acidisoma silvae TaxID=2802396 RepID=A0A963YQG6_9PROT|nr:triose-phosphate isomerase [Acidisoma silvae]MCB8874475.1 triose-phosphate isomerase [Acidisoma silvae]